MCRINANVFPGSLNSNNDSVVAMIVADSVKLTQSGLGDTDSDSQSVNRRSHDAIFTVSDELSLESPIKSLLNVLLQSLASIQHIYQSIFQINRPEIASHLVTPPPKPGLSIYREIRIFPRAVGNTGKYWEIPGNTGK